MKYMSPFDMLWNPYTYEPREPKQRIQWKRFKRWLRIVFGQQTQQASG